MISDAISRKAVIFVASACLGITLAGCTGEHDATPPKVPTQVAATLLFTVQPSNASAGQGITPAVTVTLVDSSGATVTNATDAITLMMGANPGGGTLSGTTTVNAVNGVATFSNLTIDRPAVNYSLVATAAGLTNAISANFDVETKFVALSTGYFHACGITPSGAAYCWGSGGSGALGDGTGHDSPFPVAVAGGLTFVSLSAGNDYTCGVTPTGAAFCWGANGGQLGNGTTTNSLTPVPVSGGLPFAQVSAYGDGQTCGVTRSGAAYCWGDGRYGELGNGDLGEGASYTSTTPVAVSGGLTFTMVSSGSTAYNCGVTTSSAAYCWGTNVHGVLGDSLTTGPQSCGEIGFQAPCSATPTPVSGGHDFAMVSAGHGVACGVTKAGAAYCWGDRLLGNDMITSSTTPVPVSGGLTFAMVSAGETDHACGVTTAGAAYCWGGAPLGNGTGANSTTPVAVAGGLTFSTVGVGALQSCGLTTTGVAYCWGDMIGGTPTRVRT